MDQRHPRSGQKKITNRRDGVSIRRLNNRSTVPEKLAFTTDAVFDVTVIGRADNRTDDTISSVNTFNTGLVITPDPGYMAIITGAPDLHRTGYFMTSSITIPSGNNSELIVPLFKFGSTDLELPMRVAMMSIVPMDTVFIKSTSGQNAPPVRNQPQPNYTSQSYPQYPPQQNHPSHSQNQSEFLF